MIEALRRVARLTLALWLLLLCAPVALHADEPWADAAAPAKQLTSRGRFLIEGGVGGSYSSDRTGGPDELKRWRVYATPSLTYFVRDRIGVGLALSGGVSESRYSNYAATYQDSHLFVGLSGAFDLPLSGRLSLLFQPAFGYASQWHKDPVLAEVDAVSGASLDAKYRLQTLRGVLDIRLLVRMSPSLAIGLGPDVWVEYIVDDEGLRAAQSQLATTFPAGSEPQYVRVQVGLSVGLFLSL